MSQTDFPLEFFYEDLEHSFAQIGNSQVYMFNDTEKMVAAVTEGQVYSNFSEKIEVGTLGSIRTFSVPDG